jgi:hypothetical protein
MPRNRELRSTLRGTRLSYFANSAGDLYKIQPVSMLPT